MIVCSFAVLPKNKKYLMLGPFCSALKAVDARECTIMFLLANENLQRCRLFHFERSIGFVSGPSHSKIQAHSLSPFHYSDESEDDDKEEELTSQIRILQEAHVQVRVHSPPKKPSRMRKKKSLFIGRAKLHRLKERRIKGSVRASL